MISRKKVILSRKELYDLVWSEPLSALAKKYNISDNGIRKICIGMNIPLPLNGHWTKVKYGKSVAITKLPGNYFGKDEISFNEFGLDGESTDSPKSIQRRLIDEIEKNPDLALKVPDRLSNPDKLIIDFKNYFDAVKRYKLQRQGAYPFRKDILNISVSLEIIPRALRFMDTLIKLLKARNHDIKNRYNKTYAIIEGEEIEFKLREKSRVSGVKDQWGSRQYESTGEFALSIGDYHTKTISDGKDLIETKLAKILTILESEGKRELEERIEREKRRMEREEKERVEREIKERKEKELTNFKNFLQQANHWHQSKILRNYIRAIEKNNKGEISDDLKIWLEWAKQKVNWFDPLVMTEDNLLTDKDRINIENQSLFNG